MESHLCDSSVVLLVEWQASPVATLQPERDTVQYYFVKCRRVEVLTSRECTVNTQSKTGLQVEFRNPFRVPALAWVLDDENSWQPTSAWLRLLHSHVLKSRVKICQWIRAEQRILSLLLHHFLIRTQRAELWFTLGFFLAAVTSPRLIHVEICRSIDAAFGFYFR